MGFAATLAAAGGLSVVATAAVHAALYLRAEGRRRARPGTACGATDFPRGAAVARLVLAETVASVWLVLAAAWPGRPLLGDPIGARVAVLLVAPPWLPRRALAVLGRRLARRGALVALARSPFRRRPAALARVAARADQLRRSGPGRPVTLVCYDRAFASAGAVAALMPPGALGRLVLLGAPPARSGLQDGRAVAIRVTCDPWHAATNGSPFATGVIELAAVGHLGLLVAPHVADVVCDACADGDAAAAPERS